MAKSKAFTKTDPSKALRGKTVIVGLSGGIAAYKTCTLVSRLVQCGASVHVVMTKNATEFVTPLTFETLSKNRAIVDTFDRSFVWEVEHVSLAKKADAVIIAPATANVIAKLACGIADDFLTTTLLACKCPKLFAPAMNTAMLDNIATRENINTLISRGFIPVYGEKGHLACGDVGNGRMAEPDILLDALCKLFCAKCDFEGKTVLVTAGATRQAIDPVRFLTNRSSGKMGIELALAAYRRGAKVVLIKGITREFDLPSDIEAIDVETTSQMFEAVKAALPRVDVSIMAAAPCDYVIAPSEQKIKSDSLTLSFEKARDIAAWVGANKHGGKLVIFAAETEDCEVNAVKKLKKKNADIAVLNDVTAEGAGFDVDTNVATLITKDKCTKLDIMQKTELADIILDKVAEL